MGNKRYLVILLSFPLITEILMDTKNMIDKIYRRQSLSFALFEQSFIHHISR